MEKAGLGSHGESGPQQAAAPESRGASLRPTIELVVQALVHTSQCQNADCPFPPCRKVKRVIQHCRGCRRKNNGGCFICKQLIALCCYHAKRCRENRCPVLFCLLIRRRLRRQQLQLRLQMLRGRMASMQGSGVVGQQQGPPSPTPARSSPPQIAQPPLPGPPPAAVEVTRQIQSAAETQHCMPHAQTFPIQHQTPQVTPVAPMGMNPPPIARGSSGLLEPGMEPTGMQQQPPWAQGGLPRPQQLQSGMLRPAVMPGAQPGQPLNMAPQTGLGQVGMSPLQPGTVSRQALGNHVQTLWSPRSPLQQQQVLHVLHTDPQLLATFTKPQAANYGNSNPHRLSGHPGMPQSQSGLQPPAMPGQQGFLSSEAMQNIMSMQVSAQRAGLPQQHPQQQPQPPMGGVSPGDPQGNVTPNTMCSQLQDFWRGLWRVQQQQWAGPGIGLGMADHNQFQQP